MIRKKRLLLYFLFTFVLAVTFLPGYRSAGNLMGPFPAYAGELRQPFDGDLLNLTGGAESNGELSVSLMSGGRWLEAGRLSYGKFLQDKTIDISNLVPGGEAVRVRISKLSGGASHLDAVFLDGAAPADAAGGDNFVLYKLSARDNDIIDMDAGGLTVTFPAGAGGVLTVTARIESENISKIPFQFPRENMYREMNERSAFYSYTPGSRCGSLDVDGSIGEVDGTEPFFKEFSTTGTGHPSGYTYGWVMDDGENLYVAMDFAPDNTMDGDKDYAKVYVNTSGGLKEFKVSVPETAWGAPGFTYTGRVNYQHKVYEFLIPFSEIGVAPGAAGGDIRIAFAAYGTAAPPTKNYSLAYDPQNNRFFAVYLTYENDHPQIFGVFITPDGNQVIDSAIIEIASVLDGVLSYPSVAYDSGSHKFLVVFDKNYQIWGQLIDPDEPYNQSAKIGANFPISDQFPSYKNAPSLVYGDSRFLVVWEDERTVTGSVYGQFVTFDPTECEPELDGSNFMVPGTDEQECDVYGPVVSYSIESHAYLTVYNAGWDICGSLMDNTGAAIDGNEFPDATSFLIGGGLNPSIDYDIDNDLFLLAWDNDGEIKARLVMPDGTVLGEGCTTVSSAESPQSYPKVAYNSDEEEFIVVWQEYLNIDDPMPYAVKGRLLSAIDYEIQRGDTFYITEGIFPAVAAMNNPAVGDPGYLLAYTTSESQNEPAFIAIGGMSDLYPGSQDVQMAYDPENNRFLSVYANVVDGNYDGITDEWQICGQFLDSYGTPIPDMPEFSIVSSNEYKVAHPVLAYDDVNGTFLVAYEERGMNGTSNIWIDGILLNSDGSYFSDDDDIIYIGEDTDSGVTQTRPSVTYDRVNEMFLVVWQDDRCGTIDIFGQYVKTTAVDEDYLEGNNFPISIDETLNETLPSVAYDSVNEMFLVAYGSGSEIHARILVAYETPDNPDHEISVQVNNPVCVDDGPGTNPAVAFNSDDGVYLVAWQGQGASDSADIYGRLISASGTFVGQDAITVSSGENNRTDPAVAYSGTRNEFIVVWQDEGEVYDTVCYRTVSPAGALGSVGPDEENEICGMNPAVAVIEDTEEEPDYLVGCHAFEGDWAYVNFDVIVVPEAKMDVKFAYDPANNRFLAVYLDMNGIYGRLVTPGGEPLDSGFLIAETASPYDTIFSAAYDVEHGKYLVVYEQEFNEYYYVYGQLINADGTLYGSAFPVGDSLGFLFFFRIAAIMIAIIMTYTASLLL